MRQKSTQENSTVVWWFAETQHCIEYIQVETVYSEEIQQDKRIKRIG
jgi:hypothetical protein